MIHATSVHKCELDVDSLDGKLVCRLDRSHRRPIGILRSRAEDLVTLKRHGLLTGKALAEATAAEGKP
jgi:hypothetical protein